MYNSFITKSRKYGSVIPITNGKNWDLIQSGFNISTALIPDAKDGHLPAGMLLICNEENHTAVPFKIAKVKSVSTKVVTLDVATNEFGLAPFVVGETVMKLGSDFTTDAESGYFKGIEKVDVTDAGVVLTLSAAITDLAAKDYIITCSSAGKQFGSPNAMMPFDAYKEEGAYAVTVPAARSVDGDIFENRIPYVPAIAKTALLDAGCRFGWSKSK